MESTGKGRIANRGAQAVALAGTESAAANRKYLLMVMSCRRRVMLKVMMIKMILSCGHGWKDKVVVENW